MPISEFRAIGLLQEINRQFLHPMGLALEVVINSETGEEELGGIWCCWDDAEGILFDEFTNDMKNKAQRVQVIRANKESRRLASLGFIIQPIS
jgi:hypothetical protein